MIKLYLNGLPVALFPETKIGITAMNPYFNEIGAYSYPFTIPYKPNEAVLKHAARIQSTTLAKNFIWDAILEVDGIPLLIGEAVAEGDFEVRGGEFPIVLRSGKTSFAKQSEIKKMNEVEFGSESIEQYTEEQLRGRQTGTLWAQYPTWPYVCAPLYNSETGLEPELEDLIPNYINKYEPVNGVLVNFDDNADRNVITYSFYVRYILKMIVESFGYTVDEDDLDNGDFNKWFLLSLNRTLQYFYNSKVSIVYRHCFGEITVRDFLKAIRQFGIALLINDKDKKVSIKKVTPIFTCNGVNNILGTNMLAEILVMAIPMDGYKIGYKNSEFDNDPVTAPISEGASVYFIDDIGDLPEATKFLMGNLYLSAATELYYSTYLMSKENEADPDVYAWQTVGTCRPMIEGAGEDVGQLEAVAVGQRWETMTVTKSITVQEEGTITKTWDINIEMPTFNHKINDWNKIWTKGRKYEDPPLIFLFNWGGKTYKNIEDERVTVSYPCVSGDCYDRDEVAKGNLSMRTNGEKSIIQLLVKPEQDWLLVRKQKRQYFRISILDYANFAWQDTYNVANVNYLVNSLKFDITVKGISLVEAELFTV